MIATMQRRSPAGNLRKKLRWDAALFYVYMMSPFVGTHIFLRDASDSTIVTVIVLWYAVPFAWLICTMIVSLAFEMQFGMVWNNETNEMDNTQPLKRKLVLWFAPITLPYYTIKVSLVALWQYRGRKP